MNILTLSWEYPPQIAGGLGRHVAELTPALAQRSVEVDVVTPTTEAIFTQHAYSSLVDVDTQVAPVTVTKEQGVRVHRVLVPQSEIAPDIYSRASEVNQILRQYVLRLNEQGWEWDLIHTHDWLTGFASIDLQESLSYPLITTIHATERGRGRGYLHNNLQYAIDQAEQALIENSDRVIVCSRHMFSELQSFFEIPGDRISIVPNGVNIASLYIVEGEDPNEFRAKYADPDEKIVFTISRLVHEKGVHRLVEAMPMILAECPKARTIIAGRGPETENLKRLAAGLGVTDRVNFIGFIPDEVRNLLFQVADCAVFPSLYEPFGIVALEAMALGCPVVVSDVGGLSEMVTHQETGITIYPDNAESVAWGVSHALVNPKWARMHAAKARQQVIELFNWPRIATLTKDVYMSVLWQSKHA